MGDERTHGKSPDEQGMIVREGYDKIAEQYNQDREKFDNSKELQEFIDTLPEGGFRFDSNRLPPGELITVAIDLDGVIIEGTRRLKEWSELQDELPNLDRSLKIAKRPNIDLERLRLTADEWRVISFINPKNSIRQIARATILNDFDIRRIVYGMLQAGLIEYAAPVTARGQAVSRAVASSRSRARRAQKPEVKRSIVMKLIDRVRRI